VLIYFQHCLETATVPHANTVSFLHHVGVTTTLSFFFDFIELSFLLSLKAPFLLVVFILATTPVPPALYACKCNEILSCPQPTQNDLRTEELPSLYQPLHIRYYQKEGLTFFSLSVTPKNPFRSKVKEDKNHHGVRYERFTLLRPSSGITTGRTIACIAMLLVMGTKQSI
jgi:hypothetical protein